MSILINSETIYLFKDFNDANEEISVNWRLQPIDFSVLSIKKILCIYAPMRKVAGSYGF